MLYWLLIWIAPGSFIGLAPQSHFFDYFYFSYITFTTTGYEDVYPITAFAKALVTSEIIIGIYINCHNCLPELQADNQPQEKRIKKITR
ncbi:potassium channel family protein [Desulfotruncus arcticus]|uniref:potassium channel family protein n=1 Tax=Desulfotruncus arcticus TaxID=341036 RepID=UPI0013F4EC88